MENFDLNAAVLKDNLPSYLISIHPGGRSIYLILLLLVFLILASLPLVSVQVSVTGLGIIRPIQEKTSIIAASSGIVSRVYVTEGESILKSEPLLQIRSVESRKNLQTILIELNEAEVHAMDLVGLTTVPVKVPITPEFKREYEEYLNQVDYLAMIHKQADKELSRHAGLFKGGLISEKEYDDLVFSSEKAKRELEKYLSRSLSKWQNQYYSQLAMIRELKIRIRNEEEKIRLTTIQAPASGKMIEFNGIFEGSAIQAGSIIGILSPESSLIGEFYISSQDIAFINSGQKVHIHLDAFSAREWGFVSGEVYEISSDFVMLDKQPMYRIKCKLDQSSVCLKNGYSTSIRKGMTFKARCLVRQRTLFQLLADKAENWLHPALNNQEFNLQS